MEHDAGTAMPSTHLTAKVLRPIRTLSMQLLVGVGPIIEPASKRKSFDLGTCSMFKRTELRALRIQ